RPRLPDHGHRRLPRRDRGGLRGHARRPAGDAVRAAGRVHVLEGAELEGGPARGPSARGREDQAVRPRHAAAAGDRLQPQPGNGQQDRPGARREEDRKEQVGGADGRRRPRHRHPRFPAWQQRRGGRRRARPRHGLQRLRPDRGSRLGAMLLMTAANKVTSFRFLLCILYYILLSMAAHKPSAARDVQLLTIIFILNQIIAWSDLLDGYLARKYQEVTHFGRIADPLVDKILVVGSFIFFLVLDPLPQIFKAWFAVVVLGREFLVSGIRG